MSSDTHVSARQPQLAVRLASPADAVALAPQLRAPDIAEIQAVTGQTSLDALRAGLDGSRPCYCLTDADGRSLALFGVVPDGTSPGCNGRIWMLGAELPRRSCKQFVRECRQWVMRFQADYPLLYNFVDPRNYTHVRWLRWCGFEFHAIVPHGWQGRPFWQFRRTHTADNAPMALQR